MSSQKLCIDSNDKGTAPHDDKQNTKAFSVCFNSETQNTVFKNKVTMKGQDKGSKDPINPLNYDKSLQFLNYLTASGLLSRLNFGMITYLSLVHTLLRSRILKHLKEIYDCISYVLL